MAFCFCILLFGLGWGLQTFNEFNENSKTNEDAIRSEIHTISIYPVLEGLGFRQSSSPISKKGLGVRNALEREREGEVF